MYECTYMYMYVCTYACVYVCMWVYVYVCLCVCMHACMHACMHVYMHVYMYVCMCVCMYVGMYVCMYVCMYSCMYVWMHVCMFACVYEFIYLHACMWLCVCLLDFIYECIYHVWESERLFSLLLYLCVNVHVYLFKLPSESVLCLNCLVDLGLDKHSQLRLALKFYTHSGVLQPRAPPPQQPAAAARSGHCRACHNVSRGALSFPARSPHSLIYAWHGGCNISRVNSMPSAEGWAEGRSCCLDWLWELPQEAHCVRTLSGTMPDTTGEQPPDRFWTSLLLAIQTPLLAQPLCVVHGSCSRRPSSSVCTPTANLIFLNLFNFRVFIKE